MSQSTRSAPAADGPALDVPSCAASGLAGKIRRWVDTGPTGSEPGAAPDGPRDAAAAERIDWLRTVPFIAMHVACLAVIWVGVSPIAIAVAVALYAVRMFALTGFYHRYFAHRTFRTSRQMQFVFAVIGASSVQRGPLWWAAQHRHHHRYADTEPGSAFARHARLSAGAIWAGS